MLNIEDVFKGVDETYVKIKGRWTYLYRAVDKYGKTVDFLLRAKRDVAAAKAFFRRAFKNHEPFKWRPIRRSIRE
jgi:transposase-like protein